MTREQAIEKIKKLNELCLRGIGGEAENAKRIKKNIMEKFSITENDLAPDLKLKNDFTFSDVQDMAQDVNDKDFQDLCLLLLLSLVVEIMSKK